MKRMIDAWSVVGGWYSAPDFWPEECDDGAKALEAAGFSTWLILHGTPDGDGAVGYVVSRNDGDGSFLLSIDTAYSFAYVAIPDLPSLMEFLRMYLPIVSAGMHSDLHRELSDLLELLTHERYGLLRDQVAARSRYYADIHDETARRNRAREAKGKPE